jgi:hypothetical protein
MHRSVTSTIIKPFHPRRLIGASLAVALLLALTMVMMTASASARPAATASAANVARATTTVVDKYINVGEGDGLVDANVEVMNGDEVDISVSGSIWAGVWFTGRNGPEGWVGGTPTTTGRFRVQTSTACSGIPPRTATSTRPREALDLSEREPRIRPYAAGVRNQ